MRIGNYFCNFYNMTRVREEPPSILRFDVDWTEGYLPLSLLKKGSYANYIDINFDLFRRSFQISFGLIKSVDYELALKKFKERQLKRGAT